MTNIVIDQEILEMAYGQRTIIRLDELCSCGELRSDHLSPQDRGPCLESGCKKFTWVGMTLIADTDNIEELRC